jgi:hypothetical protein
LLGVAVVDFQRSGGECGAAAFGVQSHEEWTHKRVLAGNLDFDLTLAVPTYCTEANHFLINRAPPKSVAAVGGAVHDADPLGHEFCFELEVNVLAHVVQRVRHAQDVRRSSECVSQIPVSMQNER